MEIKAILEGMSLREKIALCSGGSFWKTKAAKGVPALFLCDGPHGLRKQEKSRRVDMLGVHESRPATCFPAEVTTAGSWDAALLSEIGAAIGEEARAQGVGLVLGPGVNLKRNPLCGRGFEYFSEDPYLSGKLAAGFIRGMESQGIGACLKHFAANSQEKCRFVSNSVMDERTLRELYLPAFELAVKEGNPSAVMCAYPKLNGIHCSDSRELLTHILRTQWGFGGLVVTDWGAMNHRVQGFAAGCDLNMPGGSAYMEKETLRAVQAGQLEESAIDASASRVLRLMLRAAHTLREPYPLDEVGHHALARRAAEQGAVLLKNEGPLLPLAEGSRLAVIGAMAKAPRYQGAGSSHIAPTRLDIPLDFLPDATFSPGCGPQGETTEALLAQAATAAGKAQVAVVFAGLPEQAESEGFDRENMQLPEGQGKMIEAVATANPNTVVVLLCGCPVECPWEGKVRAILYMGLPGQAGGEAIANLLYGRANPSGKLAESWPLRYEDCVSAPYYGKGKDALYLEGLYTGYRYYDKAGKPLRWPFGHGLSYTSFSYSALRVEGTQAFATVTNTGARAGAEVAQLYVQPPQKGLHRPLRELKGFCKVFLQPGESREVSFPLGRRSFAVWHGDWRVPEGEYTLLVGGSSRELPLSHTLHLPGEQVRPPAWQRGSWYETCTGTPTQQGLETAMGRRYTPEKPEKGRFTMDNTVEEMRDSSLVMRLVFRIALLVLDLGQGRNKDKESSEYKMLLASSVGLPLRSMQIFSGLRGGIMPGLLEMANGHFWRGIKRILAG